MSLTVPSNYGYTILGCAVAPFIAGFINSTFVMKARKTYKIPLPNLYAVPGFHKDADAFNRVQRGHQNMLETISDVRAMGLIGGLKYPIACGLFGLLYSLGCFLYMLG